MKYYILVCRHEYGDEKEVEIIDVFTSKEIAESNCASLGGNKVIHISDNHYKYYKVLEKGESI